MSIRAPSKELLRVLRLINNPSRTAVTNQINQYQRAAIRSEGPRAQCIRSLTTTTHTRYAAPARNKYAPTNRDRGPKSTEDTQTDFGVMDVLGHIPAPATSVDACTTDGFHLDNGVKTEGGNGILLVGGEAFSWQPWTDANMGPNELFDTRKGILTFSKEVLGLLELLHPKPDLLIVGTGGKLWMLSKGTRRYVNEVLGCRLDVVDTANAAAAYNLLAKERGIDGGAGVGALLLPIGWVGPKAKGRSR